MIFCVVLEVFITDLSCRLATARVVRELRTPL